jgi:hypothetical protein
LLSLVHAVALAFLASTGQLVEVPLHVSSKSHSPAAVRHTVPELPAGCWHADDVPLQRSSVHGLVSSVQAVAFALKPSDGQLAAVPVQVSAKSHSPAAARHTVPDAASPSAGHVFDDPEHFSSASQAEVAARQTVVLGSLASVGQAVAVPSQVSWASHEPAAARHTLPDATAPQVPPDDGRLHAWQSLASLFPQAVLQHTPSAQKPLLHQFAPLHVWPVVLVA